MEQRSYLLLGGTGGIGAALTRRFRERGDAVVVMARDADRLEQLANETGADTVRGDARQAGEVESAVARALELHGRLDGAANLVGSIVLKPAHTMSSAEFDEVLVQNLHTAFHLVRAAAPVLAKHGGGSLVLMSSAAARHGLPNHEAIAAAKAGVEGLVRSAAASYANRNVRVNAVAPGLVRTPLSARLTAQPASLAASEAMHPLGRIGEPEEVAAALAWLLGADATWVTGQVIGIDGGLSSVAPKR